MGTIGLAVDGYVAPTIMMRGDGSADGGASAGLTLAPLIKGDMFGFGPEAGVSYNLMNDLSNRSVSWNAGLRFDFLKKVYGLDADAMGARVSAGYIGEHFLSDESNHHGLNTSLLFQFAFGDYGDPRCDKGPILVGGVGPSFSYFPGSERFEASLKLLIGFEI